MADRNSVLRTPIAADERIRNTLRREITRVTTIERTMSRAELAEASGVNVHTIDSITSRDIAKHRRVCASDALSIAWALGERAVNALLSVIAYAGATPLEGDDEVQPMAIAAGAMSRLAVIAQAAADGRIDHTEIEACREAADGLIAIVSPLSSAGRGE